RARRAFGPRPQRIRRSTHSWSRRRVMFPSPIVHHPFSFDVGPLTLTGFGLAVLSAFLIAQIVSERELARRKRDVEAAAVRDALFGAAGGHAHGGQARSH